LYNLCNSNNNNKKKRRKEINRMEEWLGHWSVFPVEEFDVMQKEIENRKESEKAKFLTLCFFLCSVIMISWQGFYMDRWYNKYKEIFGYSWIPPFLFIVCLAKYVYHRWKESKQ
jgi:hypothetical protein